MSDSTPVKILRMQQAPEIDGLDMVNGELRSRSRLPYPLFADPEGFIQQQSFWQGHVYKVIGFQNHPAVQKIDLWWDEVKKASQVEGKYLVTANESGEWSSWPTAVIDAEYQERERFE